MKLLIDTHALLWLIADDKRLSDRARACFLDPDNDLYFSIASLWEICIKLSLDKLELEEDWYASLRRELRVNRVRWLAIRPEHCLQLIDLPFHHRDPFDRLLLAQAKVESMHLLSADSHLSAYDVRLIW